MKVELNIDASNIGETVIDLFKNLSEDQKRDITLGIIKNWFDMPYGAERELKEQQAIAEYRRKNPSQADAPDYRIKDNWEIKSIMGKFRGAREQFLFEANKQVVELVKAGVTERLKVDPEIQKMVDSVTEEVKKDFPKFVHDAMIAWFCGNMHAMAGGISQALMQSRDAENISKSVYERITGQQY